MQPNIEVFISNGTDVEFDFSSDFKLGTGTATVVVGSDKVTTGYTITETRIVFDVAPVKGSIIWVFPAVDLDNPNFQNNLPVNAETLNSQFTGQNDEIEANYARMIEIAKHISASVSNNPDVNSLKQQLTNEIDRATKAEKKLTDDLAAEIARATKAEGDEVTARDAAIAVETTARTTSITAEATTRKAKDDELAAELAKKSVSYVATSDDLNSVSVGNWLVTDANANMPTTVTGNIPEKGELTYWDDLQFLRCVPNVGTTSAPKRQGVIFARIKLSGTWSGWTETGNESNQFNSLKTAITALQTGKQDKSPTPLAATQDFNSITAGGRFVYQASSATNLNRPSDLAGLGWTSLNGSDIQQTTIDESGKLSIRTKKSGTWSDWSSIEAGGVKRVDTLPSVVTDDLVYLNTDSTFYYKATKEAQTIWVCDRKNIARYHIDDGVYKFTTLLTDASKRFVALDQLDDDTLLVLNQKGTVLSTELYELYKFDLTSNTLTHLVDMPAQPSNTYAHGGGLAKIDDDHYLITLTRYQSGGSANGGGNYRFQLSTKTFTSLTYTGSSKGFDSLATHPTTGDIYATDVKTLNRVADLYKLTISGNTITATTIGKTPPVTSYSGVLDVHGRSSFYLNDNNEIIFITYITSQGRGLAVYRLSSYAYKSNTYIDVGIAGVNYTGVTASKDALDVWLPSVSNYEADLSTRINALESLEPITDITTNTSWSDLDTGTYFCRGYTNIPTSDQAPTKDKGFLSVFGDRYQAYATIEGDYFYREWNDGNSSYDAWDNPLDVGSLESRIAANTQDISGFKAGGLSDLDNDKNWNTILKGMYDVDTITTLSQSANRPDANGGLLSVLTDKSGGITQIYHTKAKKLWYRIYDGSSWGSWSSTDFTQFVTDVSGKQDKAPTPLGTGADMNDLPYGIASTKTIGSIGSTNRPTHHEGVVLTYQGNGSDKTQIYLDNSANLFARSYSSSAWGSWSSNNQGEGGGSSDTAAEIVTKLETLTGSARLPASAIKNIPGTAESVVNVVDSLPTNPDSINKVYYDKTTHTIYLRATLPLDMVLFGKDKNGNKQAIDFRWNTSINNYQINTTQRMDFGRKESNLLDAKASELFDNDKFISVESTYNKDINNQLKDTKNYENNETIETTTKSSIVYSTDKIPLTSSSIVSVVDDITNNGGHSTLGVCEVDDTTLLTAGEYFEVSGNTTDKGVFGLSPVLDSAGKDYFAGLNSLYISGYGGYIKSSAKFSYNSGLHILTYNQYVGRTRGSSDLTGSEVYIRGNGTLFKFKLKYSGNETVSEKIIEKNLKNSSLTIERESQSGGYITYNVRSNSSRDTSILTADDRSTNNILDVEISIGDTKLKVVYNLSLSPTGTDSSNGKKFAFAGFIDQSPDWYFTQSSNSDDAVVLPPKDYKSGSDGISIGYIFLRQSNLENDQSLSFNSLADSMSIKTRFGRINQTPTQDDLDMFTFNYVRRSQGIDYTPTSVFEVLINPSKVNFSDETHLSKILRLKTINEREYLFEIANPSSSLSSIFGYADTYSRTQKFFLKKYTRPDNLSNTWTAGNELTNFGMSKSNSFTVATSVQDSEDFFEDPVNFDDLTCTVAKNPSLAHPYYYYVSDIDNQLTCIKDLDGAGDSSNVIKMGSPGQFKGFIEFLTDDYLIEYDNILKIYKLSSDGTSLDSNTSAIKISMRSKHLPLVTSGFFDGSFGSDWTSSVSIPLAELSDTVGDNTLGISELEQKIFPDGINTVIPTELGTAGEYITRLAEGNNVVYDDGFILSSNSAQFAITPSGDIALRGYNSKVAPYDPANNVDPTDDQLNTWVYYDLNNLLPPPKISIQEQPGTRYISHNAMHINQEDNDPEYVEVAFPNGCVDNFWGSVADIAGNKDPVQCFIIGLNTEAKITEARIVTGDTDLFTINEVASSKGLYWEVMLKYGTTIGHDTKNIEVLINNKHRYQISVAQYAQFGVEIGDKDSLAVGKWGDDLDGIIRFFSVVDVSDSTQLNMDDYLNGSNALDCKVSGVPFDASTTFQNNRNILVQRSYLGSAGNKVGLFEWGVGDKSVPNAFTPSITSDKLRFRWQWRSTSADHYPFKNANFLPSSGQIADLSIYNYDNAKIVGYSKVAGETVTNFADDAVHYSGSAQLVATSTVESIDDNVSLNFMIKRKVLLADTAHTLPIPQWKTASADSHIQVYNDFSSQKARITFSAPNGYMQGQFSEDIKTKDVKIGELTADTDGTILFNNTTDLGFFLKGNVAKTTTNTLVWDVLIEKTTDLSTFIKTAGIEDSFTLTIQGEKVDKYEFLINFTENKPVVLTNLLTSTDVDTAYSYTDNTPTFTGYDTNTATAVNSDFATSATIIDLKEKTGGIAPYNEPPKNRPVLLNNGQFYLSVKVLLRYNYLSLDDPINRNVWVNGQDSSGNPESGNQITKTFLLPLKRGNSVINGNRKIIQLDTEPAQITVTKPKMPIANASMDYNDFRNLDVSDLVHIGADCDETTFVPLLEQDAFLWKSATDHDDPKNPYVPLIAQHNSDGTIKSVNTTWMEFHQMVEADPATNSMLQLRITDIEYAVSGDYNFPNTLLAPNGGSYNPNASGVRTTRIVSRFQTRNDDGSRDDILTQHNITIPEDDHSTNGFSTGGIVSLEDGTSPDNAVVKGTTPYKLDQKLNGWRNWKGVLENIAGAEFTHETSRTNAYFTTISKITDLDGYGNALMLEIVNNGITDANEDFRRGDLYPITDVKFAWLNGNWIKQGSHNMEFAVKYMKEVPLAKPVFLETNIPTIINNPTVGRPMWQSQDIHDEDGSFLGALRCFQLDGGVQGGNLYTNYVLCMPKTCSKIGFDLGMFSLKMRDGARAVYFLQRAGVP